MTVKLRRSRIRRTFELLANMAETVSVKGNLKPLAYSRIHHTKGRRWLDCEFPKNYHCIFNADKVQSIHDCRLLKTFYIKVQIFSLYGGTDLNLKSASEKSKTTKSAV